MSYEGPLESGVRVMCYEGPLEWSQSHELRGLRGSTGVREYDPLELCEGPLRHELRGSRVISYEGPLESES